MPHWRISPFSFTAAGDGYVSYTSSAYLCRVTAGERERAAIPPTSRSSFRSRRRTLLNAEMRQGLLIMSSVESGATTRPLVDAQILVFRK